MPIVDQQEIVGLPARPLDRHDGPASSRRTTISRSRWTARAGRTGRAAQPRVCRWAGVEPARPASDCHRLGFPDRPGPLGAWHPPGGCVRSLQRRLGHRRRCLGVGRSPVHRCLGHPEGGGEVVDVLATGPSRLELPDLPGAELRWPAGTSTAQPGGYAGRRGPFEHQLPFVTGQRHKDPGCRLASRGQVGAALPQRPEQRPAFGQRPDRADHPRQRPAQPVQGQHHHRVTSPDVAQQRQKPWPVPPHPRPPIG